ncbi:hypothetical protein OG292_29570 [Streptomyces sp. NBC_01511]|uniref:hypothetical protein n=1 Tax=unclassified Streptomyces TaxID=2593676 RepID=UPI00386ADC83
MSLLRRRRHERLYTRSVRRALGTVPHYRERYLESGAGELPPLTRDEAELRRHLLMPLGAALLPRRDPELDPSPGGPAAERVAELYEALCLAGRRPARGTEVYETGDALRDPVRAYGVTWRVRLSAAAETDPYAEPGRYALPERPTGPPALLVTDADTDADTDTGAGTGSGTRSGPLTVLRLGLAIRATPRPAGSLWYEPWLGHLGAVPPSCGELHLNPARVHARLLDGGTVLTMLRRRRPTLVHVRPEGGELYRPATCPRHARPILRGVLDRP